MVGLDRIIEHVAIFPGASPDLGMPACRRRRQETAEYLEELATQITDGLLHVQRGPTRHRSAILRFLAPPAGYISTHRHQ